VKKGVWFGGASGGGFCTVDSRQSFLDPGEKRKRWSCDTAMVGMGRGYADVEDMGGSGEGIING